MSIFELPTESSQLMASKIKKFTYRQYPATRDVSGTNFSNGSQTWRWQGASNQWWLPSQSYMRFRLSITDSTSNQPFNANDLAPALNTCSQFYQSMNMKMGGNTVSSISDYCAQVDTLKKRLRHSKSAIDSLEDSKGFWSADFKNRQAKISKDGFLLKDINSTLSTSTYTRQQIGLDAAGGAGNDRNALEYKDATGLCTFSQNGGAALPAVNPFRVGDLLVYTGIQGAAATDLRVGTVSRVIEVIDTTSFRVEPGVIGGDVAVDGRTDFRLLASSVSRSNEALGKHQIELIWKPPLSLFDVGHALPMNCMYEMVLNPHTSESIQRRIVQSLLADKTPNTDFKVSFDQAYLYLAEVEGPSIEDSSFLLELDEMTIQTEHIDSRSFSQKNFDVSPSTKAISVFYQDERANSGTLVSDSLLKAYPTDVTESNKSGDLTEEQKLSRFYLHYAGQKYPQVDWDPAFTEDKNHLTQLYIETLGASGCIFDNGGCETLQEWLDRGMYLHFQTPRHPSDRSTRCSVHNEFDSTADITNMRVAVCSHFTNVVNVQLKNGRVVDVKSAEI